MTLPWDSRGMALHHSRKGSIWLGPSSSLTTICCQAFGSICIGVIPGPKAVKDIDTFLVPLVDELVALEEGVKTYDWQAHKLFLL